MLLSIWISTPRVCFIDLRFSALKRIAADVYTVNYKFYCVGLEKRAHAKAAVAENGFNGHRLLRTRWIIEIYIFVRQAGDECVGTSGV